VANAREGNSTRTTRTSTTEYETERGSRYGAPGDGRRLVATHAAAYGLRTDVVHCVQDDGEGGGAVAAGRAAARAALGHRPGRAVELCAAWSSHSPFSFFHVYNVLLLLVFVLKNVLFDTPTSPSSVSHNHDPPFGISFIYMYML